MFLPWEDQYVRLTGENVTTEELTDIAAGMRVLPETALPRVPLVCCPYTPPEGVDPGPVVAHVELELSGGVSRFHENFIFLTFPLPDDGERAVVFGQIDQIIARDSAHNELFRCDSATSCFGR